LNPSATLMTDPGGQGVSVIAFSRDGKMLDHR
jgi:hypothetical protein